MASLSTGHMAVDFAGGVLPAMLPFLVEKYDLSYTLAAGLILILFPWQDHGDSPHASESME